MDYENDADFRTAIRCLISLGHVPAAHKYSYFYTFLAEFGVDQRVRKVADDYFYPTWFQRFFLGSVGIGTRWKLAPTTTSKAGTQA